MRIASDVDTNVKDKIVLSPVAHNDPIHMTEPHYASHDLREPAGGVALWFNGKRQLVYSGPWGYRPVDPRVGGATSPVDRIGLDLGIYRGRQKTQQTVYFDNIRYGTAPDGAR